MAFTFILESNSIDVKNCSSEKCHSAVPFCKLKNDLVDIYIKSAHLYTACYLKISWLHYEFCKFRLTFIPLLVYMW